MDITDLKIGADATFYTSFKAGVNSVKVFEKSRYDSIWFVDHLMGFIPDSIWTPDIIQFASLINTPHLYFDVFSMMSIAAWNSKKMQLGTSVTETFRRHPAVLAQTILSQDHLSRGRVILGIGAGECENTIPYGINFEKPLERLEESIKIIRLLWESDQKVSFEGKFWILKDAVLGLKPFKSGKYPPIYIGAHGPKMLELTGKLGDGWIPFYNIIKSPNNYKASLKMIKDAAKKENREVENFDPALFCTMIIDDDHEECHRMLESPLVKSQALLIPHYSYKESGMQHPLGENFKGMVDFIPTKYDRKTILDAFDKIPKEIYQNIIMHGTPDEIIKLIEDFAKSGLKHLILLNSTYYMDLSKMKCSIDCMSKVIDYFKK